MRFVRALCSATVAISSAAAQRALPLSQLGIRDAGATIGFWRSDSAPARWTSAPLASRLKWTTVADGLETSELLLAGNGEAWRTRLVVVRLDVTRLALSLDTAMTKTGQPAWKVAHAPADAVFAVNAGQFRAMFPWGLVILNGRQWMPAERGPLAVTLTVDSSGSVHWCNDGDALPPHVAWAFQSYPVLLHDGAVPPALRTPGGGIDLTHRDARLALGRQRDGSLLVALTRFDGLGPTFGFVPFGLTVPELAAVMGALGADDAVALDGGISAQLLAGSGASRMSLPGWRDVPLALVARPRR